MRVLSLGGGVQSSVMLLLGAEGFFGEAPDVAFFADTGAEPPEVYEMVGWLAGSQPVEVVTVEAEGVALGDAVAGGTDVRGNPVGAPVPMWTVDARGRYGVAPRHCTTHWKIRPIERAIRARLGVDRIAPGSGIGVEMWLGISTDEVDRVKVSRNKWQVNRWPLLEAGMSRTDCLSWWAENAPAGAPPLARSACFFCPYHTQSEWEALQESHPELVVRAAEIEGAHHESQGTADGGGGRVSRFLHPDRRPLLEALERRRRFDESNPRLFDHAGECEGVCFV